MLVVSNRKCWNSENKCLMSFKLTATMYMGWGMGGEKVHEPNTKHSTTGKHFKFCENVYQIYLRLQRTH